MLHKLSRTKWCNSGGWKPIEGWRQNHSKQTSEKQKSRSVPSCWNFITATHHVTHQSALLRMSRPLSESAGGVWRISSHTWIRHQWAPGQSVAMQSMARTHCTCIKPDTHPENVTLMPNSKSGYCWRWHVGPCDLPRMYLPRPSSKPVMPDGFTGGITFTASPDPVTPVTCAESQRALTFKENRAPVNLRSLVFSGDASQTELWQKVPLEDTGPSSHSFEVGSETCVPLTCWR